MTIKKIGLSALVAATLTTGIYAGAEIEVGGFIHEDGNETYNITYSAVKSIDLNTTDVGGVALPDSNGTLVKGISANTNDWIIFDLTGAEFDTNTKLKYKLLFADTRHQVDTGADTAITKNKIEFKLVEDVNTSAKLVLSMDDTNSTDLILPQGSTADVTLRAHGEDKNGDALKNADTGVVTILKAKTTPELTASLICGYRGKDILIDSESRTKFVTNFVLLSLSIKISLPL